MDVFEGTNGIEKNISLHFNTCDTMETKDKPSCVDGPYIYMNLLLAKYFAFYLKIYMYLP
jgi:hypothetical protein